jgi:hypothetical protein
MTTPEQHPLEPDRSLVGQPLFLHTNDHHLDECVEKAAEAAVDQANVPIIAVHFPPDPGLRPLINGWLKPQRRALSGWRVQQGLTGANGTLSLRSRTMTWTKTGADRVWVFVQWDPAKRRAHNAV